MKELSIEEKARAYDEALARAKTLYENANDMILKKWVEQVFPELAESEDEKVRKKIINYFRCQSEEEPTRKEVHNKWIAWLENIPVTIDHEKREGFHLGYKACLEKQGEQKPADKVEPKFHEGEWITNGDYTWKIVEVKPLDYILQSQDGNVVDDTISHVDEQFHSFTIQDAKDGDVLYINNTVSESIMIYKSFNNGIIKKYASYNKFGFEGEHYLTLNDGYITPATKEQRDTLEKAITNAGYTFDFEKKELKKIEPKPEENKGNIGGISPNWSEEDEEMLDSIIGDIYNADTLIGGKETASNKCSWLKSLKGRVKPYWKPSETDIMILEKVIKGELEPKVFQATLQGILEQLKKLKEE